MSTHPPHLELIEGGLTSDDVQWHEFCERIGWQQLGEPSLPEDYEDRLVERIFDAPEHNVVSITGETLPTVGAVVAPFPSWRSAARSFGAAIAVAAVVAFVVVALSRLVGDAPPAAQTVPTPAPERAPRPEPPVRPAPEGEIPKLVRSSEPKPQEPAPRRVRATSVRARPAPLASQAESEPPSDVDAARPVFAREPERRVAVISPEAELASPSVMGTSLPVHFRLPSVDAAVESRPFALSHAPRASTWRHLEMTPGSLGADHQAVALVDVVEAGRSLRGAL